MFTIDEILKLSGAGFTAEQITDDLLIEFITEEMPKTVKYTMYRPVRVVKMTASYLKSQGIANLEQDFSLLKVKGQRERIINPFTADEVNSILNTLENSDRYNLRDRAIILLAYDSGLRWCDIRDLKLEDIDANLAIFNIVNTFKLKVEKYGGHITAHLDAMDAIVNVDEMHFTNVIFNLLDNAVKYRDPDKPLDLKVLSRDLPGERLEITIADNGIGIRREDLKKIFEKFFRVSTGNRHDVKGFGLGLAYVKKMVNELGGEISVESTINVGTKFIIILPLTKN